MHVRDILLDIQKDVTDIKERIAVIETKFTERDKLCQLHISTLNGFNKELHGEKDRSGIWERVRDIERKWLALVSIASIIIAIFIQKILKILGW